MAKSGSFNTTAYSGRYLTFEWTEKSQDVAANRTTISWTLKGAGGNEALWYKTGPIKLQLQGDVVYSSDKRIELSAGTIVAQGSHVIYHSYDGTQTLTARAEAAICTTVVNCTGSDSFTLDTIPRMSQPSLITLPESTDDIGCFGEEFTIYMNRKSTAFTHTVRYEFGERSGTIATKVTTSTKWAVPPDFMNDIPNDTSAFGRIFVDTYNGSTLLGTRYADFTVKVPDTVRPTCTLTLTDVSGTEDIYGSPVQGLSKMKISVNATSAYSSPIESYSIKANGETHTTQEATTSALKGDGSTPVTVTVTDKRGRTGSTYHIMNVLAYTRPSITTLIVRRCNQDGTENEKGEYVCVVFSAVITSLNGKNTAAYKLRFKKSKNTGFSERSLTDLANVYSVTDASYVFLADSGSSYDVEVVATDRHNTTTMSTSASTAFTLMNWGADGTSMGIGKVAEKEKTLQIGLDVEFHGNVGGTIFDAILPVGSIVIRYDHISPTTLYPGTNWTRIKNAFLLAAESTGEIGQTGGDQTIMQPTENSVTPSYILVSVWRRVN